MNVETQILNGELYLVVKNMFMLDIGMKKKGGSKPFLSVPIPYKNCSKQGF